MRTSSRAIRSFVLVLLVGLVALLWATAVIAAPKKSPDKPPAKNVIIMIGDGMGFNHVQATDYYLYGRKGTQAYERFPFRYAVSTYPWADPLWGYDPLSAFTDFEYAKTHWTESDAAATAMATGVKTDAGIGVDQLDMSLENILQRAEIKGKSTGVVTSVQLSHATPAGFVAHNNNRSDYEGIAQEMFLESAVDVIMGCGHPFFDADGMLLAGPSTFKYVGGESTWDALVAGTAGGDADGDLVDDPWTLVQTAAEIEALMSGPTPKRVTGVVQVYETLQQGRSGEKLADPYVVPFVQTVPTLTEMSMAALNVLDEDPDGFVVMVEGGAIDWAAHGGQSGRMIEETVEFNDAVEAVIAWVHANSNWGETLLIVTADHETGYLMGPGADPEFTPILNNGAGVLPGMSWNTDLDSRGSYTHTNHLVPLYAKGDAARLFMAYAGGWDPVRGRYLDNTDIAQVMFRTIQ